MLQKFGVVTYLGSWIRLKESQKLYKKNKNQKLGENGLNLNSSLYFLCLGK